MNEKQVFELCSVEGNVIKLPNTQLDRKLYLKIKKAFELIGGKWKGGKTFGFVFQTDPTDLLERLRNENSVNLKKELQFYETPPEVARRMVEISEFKPGNSLLEPSAGQGAIVEVVNKSLKYVPACFEISDINVEIMRKKHLYFNLVGSDFLKYDDKDSYDTIIANPPFSKNQDIEHIRKMYDVLKPGGVMVTIASKHWALSNNKKEVGFREWLKEVNADKSLLQEGTFKDSGTMVSAYMIKIKKMKI